MEKARSLTLSTALCSAPVPLRRFATVTVIVWPVFRLYMWINHHQSGPPTVVLMPSWVPFWPWFLVPYLTMLLVSWFLPLAIHDGGLFRACLFAYLCAYLLVISWWIITPTMLPRPSLSENAWSGLIQLLWAADAPCNVTPCAHGIGPFVAAWFVGRDRPAWRWLLVAMLLVGLPSIALTWQHRPVDILLGLLAGIAGIAFGESLIRRKSKT